MSKKPEEVIPCMIPQLDLFRKKLVQGCITGNNLEKVKPVSALPLKPDVIEFVVPGRPLHFLDINNIKLRLVLRMRVKSTGANIPPEKEDNGVVDAVLHSMFSMCEVFLSEKPVTQYPHLYNYKAILDLYTSTNKDARDGPMQSILFNPDTHGNSTDNRYNAAWEKRMKPWKSSNPVTLIGKLKADVCALEDDRYILDNVPLRVKLTLANQEFFIWSSALLPDVEMVFDDAELHVPYFTGNPELAMGLDMFLAKEPARYHFKGAQLKTFIHPANTPNISVPTGFSGRLPTSVIFTMVKSQDFNGRLGGNPFDLVHGKITDLALSCNGVETKFNMNMEIPYGFTDAFLSMYEALGYKSEETQGHCFNMEMMQKGRFAVATDLTVDKSGRGASQNLDQFGTFRLQGKLKEGADTSLVLILYALYDSVIEINASREVTVL